MRIRDFLLILSLVAVAASCATERSVRSVEPVDEKGWVGEIIDYRKAVSEQHGIVGYVKTYEYTRPNHADSFRLFRVYDLDFHEMGFVNERGTGQKYTYLKPMTAKALEKPVQSEELVAQPLAYNVGYILNVPGALKLAKATAEDLSR